MTTVVFNFYGLLTKIQCSPEDKMEEIYKKYINKTGKDLNTIQFLYDGNQIKSDSSIKEIYNYLDKEKNEMNIMVYENTPQPINTNDSLFQSKDIICPICFELCRFKIDDYKISLFGCKNGHEKKNILLKDFNNLQNIDESKIICDNCKKITKSQAYNKNFYKCLSCKNNLCPLCYSIHNKNHYIINYDKKNYICNIHNDSYISFCNDCNENLCFQCEQIHRLHKITLFRDIYSYDVNDIKRMMTNYKKKIDEFKCIVNDIIKELNKIIDNVDKYYEINNNILNNFEIQNKNYQILQNINEIRKNIEIKELEEIISTKSRVNKLNNILKLYNRFTTINNKININDNNNETPKINDNNENNTPMSNDNEDNIPNISRLNRNNTEIFDMKKSYFILNLNKEEKKVYSYECININNLNVSIFEGTDELKVPIILKNNGNSPWPVGKAILKFDVKSPIFGRDIILFPQKPEQQKTYNINFNGLKSYEPGQYSSLICIHIDGKYIGEKIKIIITIRKNFDEAKEINENIDKINEFRRNFGLIKFYYPDEKILEALKEHNFSFEETFMSFFNN